MRLGWSRKREREPLRLLRTAEEAVRRELEETPKWVFALYGFAAGWACGIAAVAGMIWRWAAVGG